MARIYMIATDFFCFNLDFLDLAFDEQDLALKKNVLDDDMASWKRKRSIPGGISSYSGH